MKTVNTLKNRSLTIVIFTIVTALLIFIVTISQITTIYFNKFHHILNQHKHTYIQFIEQHISQRHNALAKRIVNVSQLKEYILEGRADKWEEFFSEKMELLTIEHPHIEDIQVILQDGTLFSNLSTHHSKESLEESSNNCLTPKIKKILQEKNATTYTLSTNQTICYDTVVPIFDRDLFLGLLKIRTDAQNLIVAIKDSLSINSCIVQVDEQQKLSTFSTHPICLEILQHLTLNKLQTEHLHIHTGDKSYLVDSIDLTPSDSEKEFKVIFFNDISSLNSDERNIYFVTGAFSLILIIALILMIKHILNQIDEYFRNNQRTISQSQTKLKKLTTAIEQAPISIVITDVNGNLEYVNPWFSKITGYSYDEAIGENPRILQTGFTADEEYIELWDEISHNKIWKGLFKNRKKSGEEYFESAIIAPIEDKDGNILNYIGIKQDITENLHLKEELKTKSELLISQSRHAAMGEMLSMIAHQWRQPISVIAMDANNIIADIELDTLDEETLRESCSDIINQTQELSKTIDDFRNFFKPNEKSKELIYIDDIINNALKITQKSLENSNIEVINRCPTHTYKTELYSRELLQVLLNIIKNAKDVFIEKEIVDKEIIIDVKKKNSFLQITIEDSGGGIKESLLEKIFEPYFSTKTKMNGTGLGLYMSKIIVTQHLQGKIIAHNKNRGACFEILLPIVKKAKEKNS